MEDEANNGIVCVCLTFLTLVLYDLKKKKNTDASTNWKLFDPLLGSVEKLKKFHAEEVKLLATEVCTQSGDCRVNDGSPFLNHSSEL